MMNAAATYSAQAAAARVRVEADSGEVDVLDFVVYDCGSVVDEAGLLGQLQGGLERVPWISSHLRRRRTIWLRDPASHDPRDRL